MNFVGILALKFECFDSSTEMNLSNLLKIILDSANVGDFVSPGRFFNEITLRAVQSSFVCNIGLFCRAKVPEIMYIVRLFD